MHEIERSVWQRVCDNIVAAHFEIRELQGLEMARVNVGN